MTFPSPSLSAATISAGWRVGTESAARAGAASASPARMEAAMDNLMSALPARPNMAAVEP